MSSNPLGTGGQILPKRVNLGERAADEMDDAAAVGKPALIASEQMNDPPESTDFVHHHGDKVCGVELLPVRKRKLHNVLTRMKDERLRGPLGVMRRCMTENIKVKVITRNYKHVRGICTGYILAFDKHWNLALKDVDEVYKNPLPKPTTKKKKRQRKRKMATVVPDGKEFLRNEKPKASANLESAADLLDSDSSSAEESSLREKRKCILKRLQELSCKESSSSEYEGNDIEDLKRCSDVAFTKENASLVSRSDRRSSTSSATGSRQSKRLETCSSKESYERSKRRGSRTDDSDLDLRDAERGRLQKKTAFGKKSSAKTQTKLKGMSSRHFEPVYPATRDTERAEGLEGVSKYKSAQEDNRPDCDESQKSWQSWLVRHVNQLFIRGDNVVLISVNET